MTTSGAIYQKKRRASLSADQLSAERAKNNERKKKHYAENSELRAAASIRSKRRYESQKLVPGFLEKMRENRKKYLNKSHVYKRESHLRKTFGLSIEEHEAIFVAQGRCCAICGSLNPKGHGQWHTDHCHKTGKVRGILCASCNWMLGNAEDNADRLILAAAYLRRNERG